MSVYYFFLLFLLFSGFSIKKFPQYTQQISRFTLIAAGLILSFFASFRYAVGYDYFSYQSIFYEVGSIRFSEIIRLYPREFLFYFFSKVVFLMGGSYTAFLFFVAVFLHISVIHFIAKYSKIPWLSLIIYICFQFYAHNMNLLRQSIAAAFFLYAYPYLKEKKVLPYCLIICLGALFHSSVLVMIPLYFFIHLNCHKKSFLLLPLAALYLWIDPIFSFCASLFSLPYMDYQNSIFWQPNSFLYVLVPAAYFFLVYFYRGNLKNCGHEKILFVNSAFFSFYINLFITKHFILERFSLYPFLLSMIILPEIVWGSCEKTEGKLHQKQEILLCLFLCLIYFSFASSQNYHGIYPYHSLLDRAHF